MHLIQNSGKPKASGPCVDHGEENQYLCPQTGSLMTSRDHLGMATIHPLESSLTWLCHFQREYVHSMEKAMAPHSSTCAWKIPWTEEPGGLQSMGSLRFRHDWETSLSLFTFTHWRRKWQPTLVFLPGESQGRGSLVGCHLWDHTELDTTEMT